MHSYLVGAQTLKGGDQTDLQQHTSKRQNTKIYVVYKKRPGRCSNTHTPEYIISADEAEEWGGAYFHTERHSTD